MAHQTTAHWSPRIRQLHNNDCPSNFVLLNVRGTPAATPRVSLAHPCVPQLAKEQMLAQQLRGQIQNIKVAHNEDLREMQKRFDTKINKQEPAILALQADKDALVCVETEHAPLYGGDACIVHRTHCTRPPCGIPIKYSLLRRR